jgi:hypothetical protein
MYFSTIHIILLLLTILIKHQATTFHLVTNKLKLAGILLSQTIFSSASIDFEDEGTYFTE